MAQIEESVARYLEQLDTADRQEPSEAPHLLLQRLDLLFEAVRLGLQRWP